LQIQRSVRRHNRLLQQLGSSSYARERILDLMRHHRRHTGHRPRRAAVEHLTIDALGNAALLQKHDDRPFRF
jgi:hypothetical protein